MIKKNSYKSKNQKKLLFLFLLCFGLFLLVTTKNFKIFVKSEIESSQQHFVTYSGFVRLFDTGEITTNFKGIKSKDILPAIKQIFYVIYDGFINDRNENLSDIALFIKFKNLNKIYNDRDKALANNVNFKPKYVSCKISDGVAIYKCKVKLKGDMRSHWFSKTRFSMRVKIQDGYINGLKDFSVHRALSRQFPYDQIFHKINSELGGLSSSDQSFVNFRVNDKNWGVMNIEPTINKEFVEKNNIKRTGVFRISNQENWKYGLNPKLEHLTNHHFISDPTIFLSQRGSDKKIMGDKNLREIYSFIYQSINSKNSKIFERAKMIDSLILALSWGDLHTLYNRNSYYTWNSYSHKLEPILTDQRTWKNISVLPNGLPFEYSILFKDSPINNKEYLQSLNRVDRYINKNDPLSITNNYKTFYFPNDRIFTISPVKKNIEYLKKNYKKMIFLINNLPKDGNFDSKNLEHELKDNDIKSFKKFVKVVHYTNGKVHIFNLLSKPVFISEINYKDEKIQVNKFIQASKKNNINKIEIFTNLKGKRDKQIKVISSINNIKKISKNNFSLIDIDTITNKKYFTKKNYCKKNIENVCFIEGKKFFKKSVIFNQPVVIHKGSKLTLTENSHLYFKSSVKMDGNEQLPISISGNGGSISIFNNSNSESSINYVNFSNLSTPSIPLMRYTGSINGYGGKFEIKNSNFEGGNAEDQLNIVNAEINLSNLNFINTKSDALDCDFCNGLVSNLKFDNITGDALDLSGSNLKISDILINLVGDKALSIGEASNVKFKNILIKNTSTGVAVKDGSIVEIKNIEMEGILNDAFMTYIKKPFFKGNTSLKVINLNKTTNINGNLCTSTKNTYAEINGDICKVSDLNVKALYQSGSMKK